MSELVIPSNFNYIAAFLTLDCGFNCPYCINKHGGLRDKDRFMSGEEWVEGLNRIVTRADLPITLQGGEPTMHPDFYDVVNGVRGETNIDVLTNADFSVKKFRREIKAGRLRREAPYASIRVSYHPSEHNVYELVHKVVVLLKYGYSVGIWAVETPEYKEQIEKAGRLCKCLGIDFRLKELLGPWKGKVYGTYKYPRAMDNQCKPCDCRTTELLIDPGGTVFRCHADLYANRNRIGHIRDIVTKELGLWRRCKVMGQCNSCDVKLKTNRFQEFGHASVEIKEIKEGGDEHTGMDKE